MPREIDEKKKRKALRKLRKAADLAARGEGPPLSDWEKEFLEEVEERIETFGSAFADPEKGNLEEPMSALQTRKLKEIDKKARGKGSSFKTRKPLGSKKKPAYTPRVRQLDEDIEDEAPPPRPEKPELGLIKASELAGSETSGKGAPPQQGPSRKNPSKKRPSLRIIKGGLDPS
ncbi:MAG: hypothetical protein WA989_09390 [Henriciella sp.]|uniref:hypothetical protein n=1 Tax=Henriciella sp. TaxID=1968823 RepID=UPI003C77B638